MYVALSRVTSLNGLFLIDDYKSSFIRADPKATTEYEILRKEYPVEPIEDCAPLSESSLTITLLNTRSLPKHAIDIAYDNIILESDLICLTETQVLITLIQLIFMKFYPTSLFCTIQMKTNFAVLHVAGRAA